MFYVKLPDFFLSVEEVLQTIMGTENHLVYVNRLIRSIEKASSDRRRDP